MFSINGSDTRWKMNVFLTWCRGMKLVSPERRKSSIATRVVTAFFLLFAPVAFLPAGAATADLTVIQIFQSEGARDESIESVMHSAMAFALAQAGPVVADPLLSPSDHLSRGELIEYAKLRRADLILSGDYSVRDHGVTVTIELVDVAAAEVIAVAEVSRALDLLFDRFAIDAVVTLRDQAYARIAELIAEKRRRYPDVPTVSDLEQPPDDVRPTDAEEVVTPAISERIAPTRPRFQVVADAGRPVPIGPFGEYFDPGYSMELLIRFNLARVSAGLSTAFIRFDPERDDMGDYVRSFVSIATDFSVTLFTIGPVEMFLRASAGAALRLHDGSPVSDRLGPALPLLRLGTGAQVWLSRSVSLIPGVSFDSMVHMFRESGGGPIGFEYIPVVRPTIAIAFRSGAE